MLLNAPAGSLSSALAAIDAGADSVYVGFSDLPHQRSQCRNLDLDELRALVSAAKTRADVLLTFNSSYPPAELAAVKERIDRVAGQGITGVIVADPGLLSWTAENHPGLRITFSVQGQCTNRETARHLAAIGAHRVVLDRDTTLLEAAAIAEAGVEVELFAYGYMCNARDSVCYMGDHWSGSPCNVHCAQKVRVLPGPGSPSAVDEAADTEAQRFGERPIFMKYYAILRYLPLCLHYGIDVLKIEGRHRSEAFVRAVTSVFREAIDHAKACRTRGERYTVAQRWTRALHNQALGFEVTDGRYVEGDYTRDQHASPGVENALRFAADTIANGLQTGGGTAMLDQLKAAAARGVGSGQDPVPMWRGPLP